VELPILVRTELVQTTPQFKPRVAQHCEGSALETRPNLLHCSFRVWSLFIQARTFIARVPRSVSIFMFCSPRPGKASSSNPRAYKCGHIYRERIAMLSLDVLRFHRSSWPSVERDLHHRSTSGMHCRASHFHFPKGSPFFACQNLLHCQISRDEMGYFLPICIS
jgi:hypothetical protein